MPSRNCSMKRSSAGAGAGGGGGGAAARTATAAAGGARATGAGARNEGAGARTGGAGARNEGTGADLTTGRCCSGDTAARPAANLNTKFHRKSRIITMAIMWTILDNRTNPGQGYWIFLCTSIQLSTANTNELLIEKLTGAVLASF